jgi:hypothetical protein
MLLSFLLWDPVPMDGHGDHDRLGNVSARDLLPVSD